VNPWTEYQLCLRAAQESGRYSRAARARENGRHGKDGWRERE